MSKRYNVRRYFRKAERNAERHIRAGNSVITGNSQQVAYTYTATDACTVKSIKLDVGMTIGDNQFAMCVPSHFLPIGVWRSFAFYIVRKAIYVLL